MAGLNRTWNRWLLACGVIAAAFPTMAAPPVFDHIVIVVEENENYSSIIGSPDAPYINSLASGGSSLTGMRAITHPSQPNYLELFSGDNQGAVDNGPVAGYPLSTANLGANLRAAGRSFVAFADGLPSMGDAMTVSATGTPPGSTYVRKHNPWANWIDATMPTPPNRLPPETFQPFTAFPTDFTTLPRVAFVIPSEEHNMHGVGGETPQQLIRNGDNWLAANLSAYATWAKTHNSLLIVTWDEDGFQASNRIATIFYGANVAVGTNAGTWTLHNLLRTIEDSAGVAHAGSAARVSPIVGSFTGEPSPMTLTFTNGTGGYAGTHDAMVSEPAPNNTFGGAAALTTLQTAGQRRQSLVRFDDVIGSASTQLPPGAVLLSSKLILTTSNDASFTRTNLHRMLVPWTESATWTNQSAGLSADGIEAESAPIFGAVPGSPGTAVSFDVTASVQGWLNGTPNYGWLLLATGTDSWTWVSSEGSAKPSLEVSYLMPGTVEFTSAVSSVVEDAGTATLTLTRSGAMTAAISVDYTTAAGTAATGSDFASTSGTVSWPANDATPRTISIPIVNDAVLEGDESFSVTLTNPLGGVSLGSTKTVTVAIKETPYIAWRVAKFGSTLLQTNALDDADADGRANVEEFGYGGEPVDPISRPGPVGSIVADHLAISFPRVSAATDLTYTVQVSSDLVTWLDGSTYSAANTVPTNENTTEVSRSNGPVEVIVVRDNALVSVGLPRYLRVKITR